MNDLALYQLERALDALTKMTRILRDEKIPLPGEENAHSKHYYDHQRNDPNRKDPFQFTIKTEPSMTPWGHSDLEYGLQYTDEEIAAMCDQAERDQLNLEQSKEQIYKNYRAAIDEYNKLNEKYEELLSSHEELQNLFYETDYEYDELKGSYNSLQDNYHKVVRQLNIVVDRNFELESVINEIRG